MIIKELNDYLKANKISKRKVFRNTNLSLGTVMSLFAGKSVTLYTLLEVMDYLGLELTYKVKGEGDEDKQ